MATLTEIGPLASGDTCPHCNLQQNADKVRYHVWRTGKEVLCQARGERMSEGVTGDGFRRLLNIGARYVHGSAFEFGFGGSGPADLALNILLDFFGERVTREQLWRGEGQAWRFHQAFKWAQIAPRRNIDTFEISGAEIELWLSTQKALEDSAATPDSAQ